MPAKKHRLHAENFVVVNFDQRFFEKHRYVLWVGAYSSLYLLIWADSFDSATEIMCDYVVDNAPGLLCDNEVQEEYDRLIAQGMSQEKAQEEAEIDTTMFGHSGLHWINSSEWGIAAEDPTRSQIHQMISDITRVYPLGLT